MAQMTSIADSIAAQRYSIETLTAQLSAYDEQLALLEQALGPFMEWSKTWADFEQQLLNMGRKPKASGQLPDGSRVRLLSGGEESGQCLGDRIRGLGGRQMATSCEYLQPAPGDGVGVLASARRWHAGRGRVGQGPHGRGQVLDRESFPSGPAEPMSRQVPSDHLEAG
ncbi:MAG TPA: hypothetical protein VHN16_06435 [Streptosporangiaceae bacterium]|nr:hypothetical protein [Streptosporangiaceae bacterium]